MTDQLAALLREYYEKFDGHWFDGHYLGADPGDGKYATWYHHMAAWLRERGVTVGERERGTEIATCPRCATILPALWNGTCWACYHQGRYARTAVLRFINGLTDNQVYQLRLLMSGARVTAEMGRAALRKLAEEER